MFEPVSAGIFGYHYMLVLSSLVLPLCKVPWSDSYIVWIYDKE